jgi:hypothetical protein
MIGTKNLLFLIAVFSTRKTKNKKLKQMHLFLYRVKNCGKNVIVKRCFILHTTILTMCTAKNKFKFRS